MRFIDPDKIVAQVGLKKGDVVADLGCGSGFYTLPACKIVGESGKVHAVDLVEGKLQTTASQARDKGYRNLLVHKGDLDKPLKDPAKLSCDVVIMGNIIHQITELDHLMKNAYSLLKTGGKLLVIEWKKSYSPFGPDSSRRVSEEQMIKLMEKYHMKLKAHLEADGYHYAIVFEK